MNVSNLENSKRLYELSGWDSTEFWYWNGKATNDIAPETLEWGKENYKENCSPAYDAGFLLRKLPTNIEEAQFVNIGTGDEKEPWVAEYSPSLSVKTIYAFADTPEDALCKLAIALFEQNILTRKRMKHE